MKITTTPRELLDKGLWDRYCQLTGTNEWALNEGLMDSSQEVTVGETVAKTLGLIRQN